MDKQYRYFYRIGGFHGQKISKKEVARGRYEIQRGWDVLSMKYTGEFRELTEEDYNEVLKFEQEILSRDIHVKNKTKGFHFPVKIKGNPVLELSKLFDIDETEIFITKSSNIL